MNPFSPPRRQAPSLNNVEPSRYGRFDRRIVESMRFLLSDRRPASRPFGCQEEEDELVKMVRMKASEFLNISFEYISLGNCQGMLFAWNGQRKVCLNYRRSPRQNILVAAHFIAHLSLGHVDEKQPVVLMKRPVCYDSADIEDAADRWALSLLSGRLVSTVFEEERENIREVWAAIREVNIRRSRGKRLLHMMIELLGLIPGYNEFRKLAVVDRAVDRLRTVVRY